MKAAGLCSGLEVDDVVDLRRSAVVAGRLRSDLRRDFAMIKWIALAVLSIAAATVIGNSLPKSGPPGVRNYECTGLPCANS